MLRCVVKKLCANCKWSFTAHKAKRRVVCLSVYIAVALTAEIWSEMFVVATEQRVQQVRDVVLLRLTADRQAAVTHQGNCS